MQSAEELAAAMRHYLEDAEWQAAFDQVSRAKEALQHAEADLQVIADRISWRRFAEMQPDLAKALLSD